jgi:hypothetical protein
MPWLLVAVILFLFAAVGGVALLTLAWRGKSLARPLRMIHGLLGAGGFVSLVIAAAHGATGVLMVWTILLFAAVLAAGAGMWVLGAIGKRPPTWMLAAHGLTATVALTLLLIHYFTRDPVLATTAG